MLFLKEMRLKLSHTLIQARPISLGLVIFLIAFMWRLNQCLSSCSFIFTPRVANSAAHSLAKEAACHKTDLCWQEDIPSNISSIVFREAVIPCILFCGIKLFSWLSD
jgi:hypothetical protein